MDLVLNNLQRLICHKTQTTKRMMCLFLIVLDYSNYTPNLAVLGVVQAPYLFVYLNHRTAPASLLSFYKDDVGIR